MNHGVRCVSVSFISLLLCSQSALADTNSIYASGGLLFTRLRNSPSVTINQYQINDYITNVRDTLDYIGGIGIAHLFEDISGHPYTLSLGAAGYNIIYSNISGTEYPFINSGTYDTLNYEYKVHAYTLLAELRAIYSEFTLEPYIIAGFGYAWNKSYDYSETPTNPSLSAATIPNTFTSKTQGSLAYEIGLGGQYKYFNDTKNHILYVLSLDYRYINTGSTALGSFPSQDSNNRLEISNLYTQSIMFTVNVEFY